MRERCINACAAVIQQTFTSATHNLLTACKTAARTWEWRQGRQRGSRQASCTRPQLWHTCRAACMIGIARGVQCGSSGMPCQEARQKSKQAIHGWPKPTRISCSVGKQLTKPCLAHKSPGAGGGAGPMPLPAGCCRPGMTTGTGGGVNLRGIACLRWWPCRGSLLAGGGLAAAGCGRYACAAAACEAAACWDAGTAQAESSSATSASAAFSMAATFSIASASTAATSSGAGAAAAAAPAKPASAGSLAPSRPCVFVAAALCCSGECWLLQEGLTPIVKGWRS